MKKIFQGSVDIIEKKELQNLLNSNSKPLRIKWGADPSAPDLHLGHTVVLRKLKSLQNMGHKIIFLIGDFTAMIGDPTGKSKTRKQLTKEEVLQNAKTYQEQIFKILDKSKTEIVYNSEWLNKLSSVDLIKLTAKYNVARMLERDDFNKRFKSNQSISIHEFLYPLLQGYDSVHLKADLEIGGTDQKFNLLIGRHLQREYRQKPQIIITMPILEGLDGVNKMSKSLNNHIALNDHPNEMFGKIMSISDNMLLKYYQLLTDISQKELLEIQYSIEQKSANPRDLKIKLGKILISYYHDPKSAEEAKNNFKKIFSKNQVPNDIIEIKLDKNQSHSIASAIKASGLVASNNEINRLINQGAVSVDGKKISDRNEIINASGECVKIGKRRFFKVLLY